MKNIHSILHIISLVLIAVLFYFQLSSSSSQTEESHGQQKGDEKVMYYVNTDTIWENYELRKQLDEKLIEKKGQYQREIESQLRVLQKEYESLQAQAQTMGQIQLQIAQNNLLKKEEEIAKYKESLEFKLLEEERQFREEIRDNIVSYIKENTGDLTYDYVMGYSGAGPLLLANDSLNLTKEIIDGLNANQQEE